MGFWVMVLALGEEKKKKKILIYAHKILKVGKIKILEAKTMPRIMAVGKPTHLPNCYEDISNDM